MSEEQKSTDNNVPGTRLTLLARARDQDAEAWDRLVSLYSPLVGYWCRSAGVHPDETEDIIQEVFIGAAKGLSTFRHDRPGDSFRGWLRGITRNVLLANFRRSKRQPIGQGGTAALEHIQAIPDPEFDWTSDDPPDQKQFLYQRALEIVRGQFEVSTWQMFWLTTVDQQPVSQVAEAFSVTTAAVRKARSRVLHRLKEEVSDVL